MKAENECLFSPVWRSSIEDSFLDSLVHFVAHCGNSVYDIDNKCQGWLMVVLSIILGSWWKLIEQIQIRLFRKQADEVWILVQRGNKIF